MPVGGTVHLHCTDTAAHVSEGADDRSAVGGEWFVSDLTPSGATSPATTSRATSPSRERLDLVLWLWSRDAGPVEIIGDSAVAERFRYYTDLR